MIYVNDNIFGSCNLNENIELVHLNVLVSLTGIGKNVEEK